MECVKKGSSAQMAEIPGSMLETRVEKQEAQKTKCVPRASSCPMDLMPGTSKFCNLNPSVNSKNISSFDEVDMTDAASMHSAESFLCRICHTNENLEKFISPCLCKGSLTYVHLDCLQSWISMSRCTVCELCQFQYSTEQTLKYTCCQSLRIWYSRSISRRALQEDCQLFLLLTLIAFGIVGSLLVAVQYYILQSHVNGLGRIWTKGWLVFFLFTTLTVYLTNVCLIIKAQLLPWYRWWQSASDIRLILENHNPANASLNQIKNKKDSNSSSEATESITQTVEVPCHQHNLQAVQQNDEIQQNTQNTCQGINAACQNITKSLKICCARTTGGNKHNNQLEKTKNELQVHMFAPRDARMKKSTMGPKAPFDGLVLTV